MINFNGQSETAISGLFIKDIKRPILPDIDNIIGSGPGITGLYDFGKTLKGRKIKILFGAAAATQAALQALVKSAAAWLDTDTVKALKFDDEPGLVYYARAINAGDIDQVYKYGEFEIEFLCPDPYKYKDTATTVNFVSNAANTTNNGQKETPPAFIITFSAAASEIKITCGSKYIRVVKTFVNGDVLTIDNKTGAIMLNGVRAIYYLDWINSEFFKLAPGANSLSVTPLNVAAITMTYTERSI